MIGSSFFNSRSEATISWITESLLHSRRSTIVCTFYIAVVYRCSLHVQSKDRPNKPPLALPSTALFQVSFIRQLSRCFMLINLNTIGKDYTYRDSFNLASTVIAPCGATTILNVNSDLRVNNAANPGGRGLITTDSVRSIGSI